MKITWLGHAAFLLHMSTHASGMRVICDPFSTRSGFRAIDEEAEIVTLSHDNPKYHSCLDDVRGIGQIVRGLEIVGREVEVRGLRFGAVQVFEDAQGDGPNTMIWMDEAELVDEEAQSRPLRVLHMGDVGHAISSEQLAACGTVDILLAPAGGAPTIALDDLKMFIGKLHPRLVIPMHMGVPQLDFKLKPVEDLVKLWSPDDVFVSDSSSVEVSARSLSMLPRRPVLHVLQAAR